MATITFNAEAGLLVRGRLRRAVTGWAWERDYRLEVQEEKGLINSMLHFKITLPDKEYEKAFGEIKHYLGELND